jgi:hypothetical protein
MPMPARSSASSPSSLQHFGPSVQMIFDFFLLQR